MYEIDPDKKGKRNVHGVGPVFGKIKNPHGKAWDILWLDNNEVEELSPDLLALSIQIKQEFILDGQVHHCSGYNAKGKCLIQAGAAPADSPRRGNKRKRARKKVIAKKVRGLMPSPKAKPAEKAASTAKAASTVQTAKASSTAKAASNSVDDLSSRFSDWLAQDPSHELPADLDPAFVLRVCKEYSSLHHSDMYLNVRNVLQASIKHSLT